MRYSTQYLSVVLVIKATMMSVATASFFPYLALAVRWNQHSFCDHAGTYLEILKVFRHRWPEVCRKPVLARNTKGVESSVQRDFPGHIVYLLGLEQFSKKLYCTPP